jgi:perosamine synthetase
MTDLAARRSIPMARPDIGDLERTLVAQVLASDTLSIGPFVETFEEGLAELAGRRHAVACSSGTAGLHLAVRACGISDGDEVLTTPFSFVASANCILYERATPRFVDIEEETLGLDPDLIEDAATDHTRAVLPVHVFGNPCRIADLEQLATERRWRLIEDSCEALGARLRGRPAGSFGDASVFAFYPNKQITTGEGGIVVTDDDGLAADMRSMRNQGRDADSTWLRHVQLGFNYRLDELSAALGVAQLQRREELRSGRDRVAHAYRARLDRLEWLRPPSAAPGAEVDWFVYVIRLNAIIDRDALIGSLAEQGIPARPYFSPIHLQPFYRTTFGYREGDFPVTERVAASCLALPFSSRMTDDEVDYVCERLVASVAGSA